MARYVTPPLAVIAKRTDAYDFAQENGERMKGENDVLVVLDPSENKSRDIKVHRDSRGLFTDVAVGEEVVLLVEVRARANKLDERAVAVEPASSPVSV